MKHNKFELDFGNIFLKEKKEILKLSIILCDIMVLIYSVSVIISLIIFGVIDFLLKVFAFMLVLIFY
jgi:hypothetical protein